MARKWTLEQRARQAQKIRQWKPWERSSGPKTVEGKVRSARNAFKGGERPLLRQLARQIKEHDRLLRDLVEGA